VADSSSFSCGRRLSVLSSKKGRSLDVRDSACSRLNTAVSTLFPQSVQLFLVRHRTNERTMAFALG
jgi:hypothetical protein